MPDVYQTWGISNEETIPNGQVLALNEIIDKVGPNLKKNIPQAAWDAVSVNGKIMGIPQPQEGSAPGSKIGFVRKDWLDKVGLPIPKTSEEYLTMLRAFRDKDPNGNGKQDEIPFSMREKITWADNIFGMWGVNLDSFTLYNDEIIPDIIHPNTKLALGFLNTMVKEKLIDSEFLTNSGAIWQQKIFSDTVGAWNHQPSYGWFFQDQMNNKVQGKKTDVITIPTPRGTGYTGPVGGVDQPVLKTFIIMKNAKNPEAIVRLLDWMITEEGAAFAAFGIPGETYKKEGEKYVYDLTKDKTNPLYLWRGVLLNISGFNEKISRGLAGSDEAFNKLNAAFEIAKKEGIPNPNVTLPIAKASLDNPELGQNGTLFQEAAAKIILGNAPLDSFDEFVKTWRKQGGDNVIKQKTEAYKANVKK
jgi:putative aldouronate transport system substrate-binding protein